MVTAVQRIRGSLGTGEWIQDGTYRTPQQFMLDFWGIAEAHVMKRWGQQLNSFGGQKCIDAGLDVANNAVMDLALQFHAMCAEKGQDSTSTVLFRTLLYKRIEWNMLKYIERDMGRDRSLEAATGDDPNDIRSLELVRTQLTRHRPVSLLQRDIVDFIGMMRFEHQIVMAMFFFDEVGSVAKSRILNTRAGTLSNGLVYATAEVLNYARNQISGTPVPGADERNLLTFNVDNTLTDRLLINYGTTDPHAYLAYVWSQVKADTSYIVDILRHGNGERVLHKHSFIKLRPRPLKLDSAQVTDILAALAAGQSGLSLSQEYNVSTSTIYKIRDGKRTAREAA